MLIYGCELREWEWEGVGDNNSGGNVRKKYMKVI
jgi:hypothetical protein